MPLLTDAGYNLIVLDLRGMGDSARPADGYDKKTIAAEVAALMRQLGHERFSVAGHDLGAQVACALGRFHPDQVANVAVLDAPVPGIPPWDELTKNPRLWHWTFYNVPDLPEATIGEAELPGSVIDRSASESCWMAAQDRSRQLPSAQRARCAASIGGMTTVHGLSTKTRFSAQTLRCSPPGSTSRDAERAKPGTIRVPRDRARGLPRTDGVLVRSYLAAPQALPPLGTLKAVVADKEVRGGRGAKFLVDWAAPPCAPRAAC